MKAVLDANVFFSMWITDPLLSFAEASLYEPVWSERIMEEVRRHLPEVWSRASPADVRRYVNMVCDAFPSAMVDGWERYERLIDLPDRDDCHVAVAALASRAEVIVTSNLKHFPEPVLSGFGIRAMSPDGFLTMLFDDDPEESIRQMCMLVASKRHPPRTMDVELKNLERLGMKQFASRLRSAMGR